MAEEMVGNAGRMRDDAAESGWAEPHGDSTEPGWAGSDEGAVKPDQAPPREVAALDVTVLPTVQELLELALEPLAAWMPHQRWFAHKTAGAPELEVAGWVQLPSAPDALVLDVVLRASFSSAEAALYQVPLVLRHPAALDPAQVDDGSEVCTLDVPGGPVRVEDAARDAMGRASIVQLLLAGAPAVGSSARISVQRSQTAARFPVAFSTRLLGGEQSNSSIIAEAPPAVPLILKMFRVLADGENPDVVLQSALTERGSRRVPPVLGSAHIEVGGIRSHALFAQEFLPGVEDAWRTALREAADGADFTEGARELGAALAAVHRDLAAALGTVPADDAVRQGMVEQMEQRLDGVCAQVPQVAAHRAALHRLLHDAARVPWPPMQRIHGDLHLGQVLATPDRGWVLLDFEGEPLRPLEQRSQPDSPLRDVAGMLRSLDYVAGAVALEQGRDVSAWSLAARAAFVEGYGTVDGLDEPGVATLLAAFEADKAVYEALYEASNRPDWLPIPLGALQRISEAAEVAGSAG
ncbi:maltokinase N-terminal cap-like domain-containing protein [Brachybacterium timonense]|uniref:maltokinase N-terminal cap-like domain-containing protein n=1 Tax=Brachybacterium timonense TaxID=2050896 RepID=UPI001FEA2DEE|nr:phosphotransferase [Brachybacterium timonense]